jgi:hypothetical protein
MSTPNTTSMAARNNQNVIMGVILSPEKSSYLSYWEGYHAGFKSPRRAGYDFVMDGLTGVTRG